MIVCPNTSPLLVLARIGWLELLGDPARIVLTAAVLAEVRDKDDLATDRINRLASVAPPAINPAVPAEIDPTDSLGAGERSVLGWALAIGTDALCVLDDAAARVEARRLGIHFTGTVGVVLRGKVGGRLPAAAPVLAQALSAGLYLDDAVLRAALAEVGEAWP